MADEDDWVAEDKKQFGDRSVTKQIGNLSVGPTGAGVGRGYRVAAAGSIGSSMAGGGSVFGRGGGALHGQGDQPPPLEQQPGEAVAAEEKAPTPEEVSLLNKKLHSKLVDVSAKLPIDVQHKDPASPLYSVKSFELLHLKPELLKGIYAMGFNFPSKIQENALPALLADPPQNMIAQSQSGTGKTAAFALCMLSRINTSLNHVQCIVLSPTYELALQTGEVIRTMAKFMPNVNIRYAVRGNKVPANEVVTDHILVGTPGTLLDWANKFKFFDLKQVSVFVFDEADVMISQQGHMDQSIRLQKQLSPDCQLLLFSATYEPNVMKFAQKVVSDPVIIRVRKEDETLDNIKQYYIRCPSEEYKLTALCNIYGTIAIGQSMVFCQTKRTAGWLAEQMSKAGHAVGLLSGDMDITQRQAVMERFRDGKEKVLITTNLSARGLDIEQVTVVVNFDLPVTYNGTADFETYLHRIGRTGRFGKSGLAINMIDSKMSLELLHSIEKHFSKTIFLLDTEDADEIEKITQQ